MIQIEINKKLFKSIITVLLICFSLPLLAQTDTISTKPTVEAVDFRIPTKEIIEQYQKDKRFQYIDEKSKLDVSWLSKLKYWIFDKLFGGASDLVTSGLIGWIAIVAGIILIIVIILKLTGVNFKAILGKKKLYTPEIEIYTENVHEMDFETLMANALRNNDYRLAVRFLYLKNLKLLSDNSIIKWNVNKTNYNYQYEIPNNTLRSKFLDITFIFDYVWYGEFALNESDFSKIRSHMDEFNKMVAK